MNEHEFDQRIKESALSQESGIEKPLWNKTGTWNRIDSGLEKKVNTIWWKIAAVILLFFSLGITYALWIESSKYKLDKQLELSELQQQINALSSKVETEKETNIIILQQKNREIESLKNQLSVQQKNKKSELRKLIQDENKISETGTKQAKNEHLIDSLKNTIVQLQAITLKAEKPVIQEQKPMQDQNKKTDEKEIAPERQIRYISNHFQPENISKKKKGLKIGILGLPEDAGVQYQSDYSIFKK